MVRIVPEEVEFAEKILALGSPNQPVLGLRQWSGCRSWCHWCHARSGRCRCLGFIRLIRLLALAVAGRAKVRATVPILRAFVVALAQVAGDVGRPAAVARARTSLWTFLILTSLRPLDAFRLEIATAIAIFLALGVALALHPGMVTMPAAIGLATSSPFLCLFLLGKLATLTLQEQQAFVAATLIIRYLQVRLFYGTRSYHQQQEAHHWIRACQSALAQPPPENVLSIQTFFFANTAGFNTLQGVPDCDSQRGSFAMCLETRRDNNN